MIEPETSSQPGTRKMESLYRTLLDSVLDPTIAIDGQGQVLMASASCERVFGWRPDDLVGRNIKVLMPEPYRDEHDSYLENYRRTGETNILGQTREFEVVRKDGKRLTVELSVGEAKDLPDCEGPLYIGSFRDITERKRAQKAERAMLRALATVGESATLLAHEIKNPITAVNVALTAVADQLGEDHEAVLDDLVRRMKRLEQIMRRTLTFSKPLSLNVQPIKAIELLEDAVQALRPEILENGAEVRVSSSPEGLVFHGDRGLIEEVLVNLLKNAVEAGSGQVQAELSAVAEPPDHVRLVVEDDGPGIPPAIEDQLFNPFATTKATGSGLGLAFSKKVVEAHGGTIEAELGRLGGARFTIHLPSDP
jgi:two-component system sensor kinase FixL